MILANSRHRGYQFIKIALNALLWLTVLSSVSFAQNAQQNTTLYGFQVEDQSNSLRLIFNLDTKQAPKIFTLNNPERIVLDFQNTSLIQGLELKTTLQPLKRIRYASRADGLLRVVLDMEYKVGGLSHQSVATGKGFNLLIDIHKRQSTVKKAKPVKSIPSRPHTVSKKIPNKRNLVIAIDAGHGGKDPGALGKAGTFEKDVVLKIAQKLYGLLEKEAGYKPYLTRSGDNFLSLRERIKRARKQNADLFISIHADAAKNRQASGSSVYVLSQNGATSEAARRLAQRENAVDLLGGVSLRDKEDTLAHVLLDLTQRHTQDVSYAIAASVRSQLGKISSLHGKRVEKAGFVVLKSPDIPSILVETAFISNKADEKRLRTKKYQLKLAKSLLRGIKQYFYQHADANTIVAQLKKREHIIRSGDTLSGIAYQYKVGTSSLRQFNGLNSDVLRIGQKLKIPVSDT